jgi:predicted homoserine dehydrogenase-like protein
MNYTELFKAYTGKRISLGILGANGGFGYSFLAQIAHIDMIDLQVVCDVEAERTKQILIGFGYQLEHLAVCRTAQDIKTAQKAGNVVILEEYNLLSKTDISVLVEATGNPEVSAKAAEDCLMSGIHVCMVSKETDSVVGGYLHSLAAKNNLVYTTVDGDQPGNLIGLYSWVTTLGLEVIAAGKSSEYDYVYDPSKGTVQYTDQIVHVPGLADYWELGEDVSGILEQRKSQLSMLPLSATPDYCEMNIVSNAAGLIVDTPEMHYPLCKTSELADVFIPVEDGGILTHTGVVDVFNTLRRPDEASFAGGVFVIVKVHNREVWDMLASKGHVVSRNKKYACLYLPYHIMGVEAPVSVLLAGFMNIASGGRKRVESTIMSGITERSFKAGESFVMSGHHHTIEGVKPQLVNNDQKTEVTPFYLLADKLITCDIPCGVRITSDMVDLSGSDLARMRDNSQQ